MTCTDSSIVGGVRVAIQLLYNQHMQLSTELVSCTIVYICHSFLISCARLMRLLGPSATRCDLPVLAS